MLRRTILAALAATAMAGAAAPAAQADVTVPGCYGVAIIFCDPTVSGVETYGTTIPVCAGTCTDVPVTLVRTAGGEICTGYRTREGYLYDLCVERDGLSEVCADDDVALYGTRLCLTLTLSPVRRVCVRTSGSWTGDYQACLPQ